jgi:hypothetical protein
VQYLGRPRLLQVMGLDSQSELAHELIFVRQCLVDECLGLGLKSPSLVGLPARRIFS